MGKKWGRILVLEAFAWERLKPLLGIKRYMTDCVGHLCVKSRISGQSLFLAVMGRLGESQVGAAAAASAHGPESPGGALRLPSNTSILTAKLGCWLSSERGRMKDAPEPSSWRRLVCRRQGSGAPASAGDTDAAPWPRDGWWTDGRNSLMRLLSSSPSPPPL